MKLELKKREPRKTSRFSYEPATECILWHGDVCVAWNAIPPAPTCPERKKEWCVAYEDIAEELLGCLEEGGLPDVPKRGELIAALVRCI